MLGGNYAMSILKQTSRTFYIPCALLPSGLKETVCSAYLSFRAIDEIEDSETLTTDEKVTLLREISSNLLEYNQNSTCRNLRLECLEAKKEKIPEVSQKLVDWIFYSNKEMIPKIVDATSAMADRMSYWCEKGFDIQTEKDLNSYTFSVAGSVGLLLSDIWLSWDNTKTDRNQAIAFGRALQAVNILRNQKEDLTRGVTFYPRNWNSDDMFNYADNNMEGATLYMKSLSKRSPAFQFCSIPYSLASATLKVLRQGKQKLTRQEVLSIVESSQSLSF